ncbi:MAG: hypothetical protein ACLPN5_08190 [Roseiarcus sp.]
MSFDQKGNPQFDLIFAESARPSHRMLDTDGHFFRLQKSINSRRNISSGNHSLSANFVD